MLTGIFFAVAKKQKKSIHFFVGSIQKNRIFAADFEPKWRNR